MAESSRINRRTLTCQKPSHFDIHLEATVGTYQLRSYDGEQLLIIECSLRFLTSILKNTRRGNPYINNNTNERLLRYFAAKPRHLPTWRPVWGPNSFPLMVESSRIDRGKICRVAVVKRLLRRVAMAKPRV